MKPNLLRWSIIIAVALINTACVNLPQPMAKAEVRSITKIASKEMLELMQVGKSTKQEVFEKFGVTRSVKFDSGYEVWAYQIKQDGAINISWVQRIEKLGSDKGVLGNLEVVLLFDPAGVLSKKRVKDPLLEAPPEESKKK